MEDSRSDQRKAPFGPWKTFRTFLESDLKAKTIPPQLDSSLYRSKSGTDASYLRTALPFFGLVQGEKAEPTDRLRRLVAAIGTDAWKAAITELLSAYDPIVEGVDIANGTQKALEDAFRARTNLSGSTLRKGVRLYLAIATEAGVKLSPHFVSLRGVGGSDTADTNETNGASAPSTPAAKNARKRKGGNRQPSPDGSTGAQLPEGVDEIRPLAGCEFRVWLPRDISDGDLAFSLDYLKRYLKLKGKTNVKF